MRTTAAACLTDADITAIVEHCIAHGDEPLPRGVLAVATSNQLDAVARMLERGGFHADARHLQHIIKLGRHQAYD